MLDYKKPKQKHYLITKNHGNDDPNPQKHCRLRIISSQRISPFLEYSEKDEVDDFTVLDGHLINSLQQNFPHGRHITVGPINIA